MNFEIWMWCDLTDCTRLDDLSIKKKAQTKYIFLLKRGNTYMHDVENNDDDYDDGNRCDRIIDEASKQERRDQCVCVCARVCRMYILWGNESARGWNRHHFISLFFFCFFLSTCIYWFYVYVCIMRMCIRTRIYRCCFVWYRGYFCCYCECMCVFCCCCYLLYCCFASTMSLSNPI